MPLSELSQYVRNIIKWGAVGLVALVIFKILISAGISYYKQLFPAPPPPPTLAFGKLPQVRVPGKEVNLNGVRVFLDTIEATPAATAKVLPVYKSVQPSANLLSLDNAKNTARLLSFLTDPTPLSATEYKWVDSTNPNRELVINIVTGNFSFRYNYLADPSILATVNISKDDAVKQFKNFLSNIHYLTDDLGKGVAKTDYVSLNGNQIKKVSSPSEATAIQVSLQRKKIEDKYPFAQKKPDLFYVNALVGSSNEKTFISVNFNYQPIDLTNKSATYPLIPSSAAWQSFLDGNGVVVQGGDAKFDTLRITDIYLAYWEPLEQQDYFEPIFVITGYGRNGDVGDKFPYTAYLPAITAENIVQ